MATEEEQAPPIPFKAHAAMLLVSCGAVGYFVISKSALNGGVNLLVFCLYRDAIAVCILVPLAFFTEMKLRPKCSVLVLNLMLLIGVFGCFLEQTLFLVGLENTTTFFASAMQNCTPVFVLLIAATFRTEEVRYRKRDGQAKILGIVLCVWGALLMLIYKGPAIFTSLVTKKIPPNSTRLGPRSKLLMEELIVGFEGIWGIDRWTLGGLCLILGTLSTSISNNLQVATMARFPAPISVIAGMTFSGFILIAIMCYFTVDTKAEWVLHDASEFAAAVYGALITSGMNKVLRCWSIHNRGPIFEAAYAPVTPVMASIFGVFVLGESLFLGSLIGTALIISGLFLVTWGQTEERRLKALSEDLSYPTTLGASTRPRFCPLETPLLRYSNPGPSRPEIWKSSG
ncbi:unnamed protein product [Sphagnum compactum]